MNENTTPATLYTQESNYEQAMNSSISHFWQKRESVQYRTSDGALLNGCQFRAPHHSKAIMIVNGRIETIEKYQELFFDLFQLGFDIYSYDHRGQGLSTRTTPDSDIGHIEDFSLYVDDLNHVVNSLELDSYSDCYLLAHSMGGAITLRYLQEYPTHPFRRVALSAPMLGLPIPWHLRPVATSYTRWLSRRSPTPSYAPGYGAYVEKPFENNPLSQSQSRYLWFRKLYKNNPNYQVGGPSSRWVWQSLLALKTLHKKAKLISVPLLVLQAGNDCIVDNQGQLSFIAKLRKTNQQAKLKSIANAKHELLFEKDEYRNIVLDEIRLFFESVQSE